MSFCITLDKIYQPHLEKILANPDWIMTSLLGNHYFSGKTFEEAEVKANRFLVHQHQAWLRLKR